jgi:hypothetical protein
MSGVEGIPQRDQVVTFSQHYFSYNPGEVAAFTAGEKQVLSNEGAILSPPVNTQVPNVSQVGSNLTCTMGTWNGVPTSYAYQWRINGTNVGINSPTYATQVADVGGTGTCIVTATNAAGSTAAPVSNGVVVT